MLEAARLDTDQQDDILKIVRIKYGMGASVAIRQDGLWAFDGLGACGKGDTWEQALAALAWSRRALAEARAPIDSGRLVRLLHWLMSVRRESW